jgi:methylphosphotriester-DNA--protein-cysteine methyltransferase
VHEEARTQCARAGFRASKRSESDGGNPHLGYGALAGTAYAGLVAQRQRTTQPKTWRGVQHARVG